MELLLRPEENKAQLRLSDQDNPVQNFLFVPALAGLAQKALAPAAKAIAERVVGRHAGETVEAIGEEEELEDLFDVADAFDAEVTDEITSDEHTPKLGISSDGQVMQLSLPYMDVAGADRVVKAIHDAARELGMTVTPGDLWEDAIVPVGDVEVKNFLPAIAGALGGIVSKIPIVGKLFGGLFGKKKKKKKKKAMQAGGPGGPGAPPETEEERYEREARMRKRKREEELEELEHKRRITGAPPTPVALPYGTPPAMAAHPSAGYWTEVPRAAGYTGPSMFMHSQTGMQLPASALPAGATVMGSGVAGQPVALPGAAVAAGAPTTGVERDPAGNVRFTRTDLNVHDMDRLGVWGDGYGGSYDEYDFSPMVHDVQGGRNRAYDSGSF